jgi:hypothetical protein
MLFLIIIAAGKPYFYFHTNVLKHKLLIAFFCWAANASGQVLGGNAAFNFAKLSNTPQLTALGGINVSAISNNVGMAFHNPALLRNNMHGQMNAVFNAFYAGTSNVHLMAGYHHQPSATNFALGINYFSYGTMAQTDAVGNILGNFSPTEFVVQASASHQYLDHWFGGASIKLLNSNFGNYGSTAVAMDVGVNYWDSSQGLQAGVVIKNVGTQLSRFNKEAEQLPFDFQLGITKRLAKAPFAFSLTAHHLHQFKVVYNDTTFNNDNVFGETEKSVSTGKELLSHLILATEIFIGDKLAIRAGYDFLRRNELSLANADNGLIGFSFGFGLTVKKFQLHYARSYHQNNAAWNQFGINFQAFK